MRVAEDPDMQYLAPEGEGLRSKVCHAEGVTLNQKTYGANIPTSYTHTNLRTASMHEYRHTCIHIGIQAYRQTNKQTLHYITLHCITLHYTAYIRTYIHTYMHTYHSCMYICEHKYMYLSSLKRAQSLGLGSMLWSWFPH